MEMIDVWAYGILLFIVLALLWGWGGDRRRLHEAVGTIAELRVWLAKAELELSAAKDREAAWREETEFVDTAISRCPLSLREINVLEFAVDGLPNKVIAKRMGISIYTCKNHMHNILVKLGVKTRLEAVLIARRYGWLRDESKSDEQTTLAAEHPRDQHRWSGRSGSDGGREALAPAEGKEAPGFSQD